MEERFAVIDACDQGISAISVRWARNGEYKIDAFHRGLSGGVSEGVVNFAPLATDRIKQSMEGLIKKTGKKIRRVYSAVSSPSVDTVSSQGTVLISKYGRDITERDISRCVDIASSARIPLDRVVLHRYVTGFSIDGEPPIADPSGLEAVKLQAEVRMVTINNSVVNNFSKCIAQAGYVPAGFVFSGVASSLRVLSKCGGLDGTALINVNSGSTEVLLFSDRSIEDCKVFPYGWMSLTKGEESRDEETFDKLCGAVRSLRKWPLVKRVVTGGRGAPPVNIIEGLEEYLEVPVSPGICAARPFEDLPQDRTGYTIALGVLDKLKEDRRGCPTREGFVKRAVRDILRFLDEYF